MTDVRARRGGAQSGFTLIEVLLTVAVISAVMIPLIAFMALTIERGNDQGTAGDTTAFTQVSQFLNRDIASSESAIERTVGPSPTSAPDLSTCGDPAAEGIEMANATSWLWLRSTDQTEIVYLTEDTSDGVRLWRRSCSRDDSGVRSSNGATMLAEGLTDVDNPAGGTLPVYVECSSRFGPDTDRCGEVAFTLKGEKQDSVTVRAVRRVRPRTDDPTLPTALITCSPDCRGDRDSDQNFVVQLDGSLSTSPAGITQFIWTLVNLDKSETTFSTEETPDAYDFGCVSGSDRWNVNTKGCTYQVRLTIIDSASNTDTATATIFVRNSVPTLALTPNPVNGRRGAEIEFNTGGTVDADGTALCYEWNFNDPVAATDDQVSWCTGDPIPSEFSSRPSGATQWEPGLWFHTYTTEFSGRSGTVTVTDADGESDSIDFPLTMENAEPIASITSSTGDRLLDIPTGPITWNGDQSYDPDGLLFNPAAASIPTGTNAGRARVASYEWSLTREDGSSLFLQNGQVAQSASPSWAFEGFFEYGVFILTLRVTDAEGKVGTTTRSITVNKAPRSIVTVAPSSPAVITPANGQPTFTLDGGSSFDPDDGGFITDWKWYVWSAAAPSSVPTATCSSGQAPPCIINGSSNPTLTIGPNTSPPVPFGSYRVQLVVTDDNGEISQCQGQSPYTSACADQRTEFQPMGNAWVELKINRAPTVPGIQNTPNVVESGVNVIRRETDVSISASPGTIDPDGTISSYQWSFARVGGGDLGLYPTDLNVANPTVKFFPVSPTNASYNVVATLRVTDDNGGFTTVTRTYSIRNRVPTSGITVRNDQTDFLHNTPNYPVWTVSTGALSTACPTSATAARAIRYDCAARFQMDAGAAQDPDGQIQTRRWRVWRLNGDGSRTQLSEFSDVASNGSTCTVASGSPTLLSANCFVFSYEFTQHGTYIVGLEVQDNDGATASDEVQLKVNQPPTLSVATNPSPPVGVTTGTNFTFGFTPTAADTANGGTISSFRYDWGDGVNGAPSFTTRTTSATTTKQFNRATLNTDGSCATNTGTCAQWRVTVMVTNNTLGTALVDLVVRINQAPVARVIDPNTGVVAPDNVVPLWRLNCPPTADPNLARCAMPPWDASPSFDPDSAAPIAQYRWYEGNYIPSNPTANLRATTTTPTAPPFEFDVGYTLSGKFFQLVVVDADGAFSALKEIRVSANRAPRLVQITSPTGASPVPIQRNVLTTFAGSTQDDENNIEFIWRFETLGGDPITFRNAAGDLVTSVTSAPIGTALTKISSVQVRFPDLIPGVTGRAVLTVRDSLNLTTVNQTEYRFNVVDASPVAVISRVSPPGTSSPIVFTSDQATPPASSFTLNGAGSFDPDSGPGATQGPVVAYGWVVDRITAPTGTVGGGCTTGRINSSAVGDHSCTLPQVYGTYRVTLTVWDVGDRTGTATWDVRVNQAPTATFTATPSTVTGLSTPVAFNAAGSTDPDGTVSSYTWDFGDGSPPQVRTGAANNTITHTYTAYGVRTVTLTVTDNNGGTTTSTRTVTVNRAPTATITATRANGGACASLTPCGVNVPAPYRVTFDSLSSSDPDGSLISHQWLITGPGLSDSRSTIGPFDIDFPGPGLYDVSLTVTDNWGATSVATGRIRVNLPPTAVIGGPATLELRRGLDFTFDGSGSTDADGNIANYRWEFLDHTGTPVGPAVDVTTPMYVRSFSDLVPLPPATGTGTVRLTVTDELGGVSSTTSKPFTVGNQLPLVEVVTTPSPATITPENPTGPEEITLDGSGSSDPDGPPLVSYEWLITDTSDASTFTVSGPSISLGPDTSPALPAGSYTAVLTVTDVDGDEASSSPVPLKVNRAPVAVADVSPLLVNPPDTPVISFSADSSFDVDGTIESYAWQVIGPDDYDETFTGEVPADLTLPGVGTYVVTLTLTDDDGGVATAVETVRVNAAPTAGVIVTQGADQCTTIATPAGCLVNAPFDVTLDGTASTDDQQVVTYAWTVLDQANAVIETSNQPSWNLTLPAAGGYTVQLTITDNEGASAALTGTIDANGAPVGSIAGDEPIRIGRGADFTFDGSSTVDPEGDAIVGYSWEVLDDTGAQVIQSEVFATPSFVWSSPVLIPVPPATGTGTVRLTVEDERGAVATVQKSFVVVNRAPEPIITADPSDLVNSPGFAPEFSPAGSQDPDGQVISGTWEIFEDGNPTAIYTEPADLSGSPAPLQYQFDDFGTFVVRLTLTDNDGESGIAEETVKINRPPVAGIRDAGSLTAPVGVPVEFDGSSPDYSNDPDGTIPIDSYIWVWEGPGSVAPAFAEDRPVRTFDTPGTYTVTLVITDENGATAEAVTQIVVTP